MWLDGLQQLGGSLQCPHRGRRVPEAELEASEGVVRVGLGLAVAHPARELGRADRVRTSLRLSAEHRVHRRQPGERPCLPVLEPALHGELHCLVPGDARTRDAARAQLERDERGKRADEIDDGAAAAEVGYCRFEQPAGLGVPFEEDQALGEVDRALTEPVSAPARTARPAELPAVPLPDGRPARPTTPAARAPEAPSARRIWRAAVRIRSAELADSVHLELLHA